MAPDAPRLRARLADQLGSLRQLEVVESAERLVRRYRRQLLSNELGDLRGRLTQAQRHLAAARNGSNPTIIALAEERVCALLRETIAIQRHVDEEDRAFRRAQCTFLADRAELVEQIDRLQRLLA